jgi:hypothetical protein
MVMGAMMLVLSKLAALGLLRIAPMSHSREDVSRMTSEWTIAPQAPRGMAQFWLLHQVAANVTPLEKVRRGAL